MVTKFIGFNYLEGVLNGRDLLTLFDLVVMLAGLTVYISNIIK